MKFNKKLKYYKIIVIPVAILLFALFLYACHIINIAFIPNVKSYNSNYYLKIPTGSEFDDVVNILANDSILRRKKSFVRLAKMKNYPKHVYSGRYRIKKHMNNNSLINLLRSGNQEPLNLTFNNIRTKEKLAKLISLQIEADSVSIDTLLRSNVFLNKYNLTNETALAIFIPNTYQFFWNTDAKTFFNRMYYEFTQFWEGERSIRAEEIGLTPIEVVTLASIVDEEALLNEELQTIAGVYMNRLKKRYRLQADPTIKFILGNFEVKRILYKDLENKSPYNTYIHFGLPPGPISVPSIAAIEAVLNYEKHNYLYFCAREDFSGYHNYAKTLIEHNKNKDKYIKALNKKKVYR